MIYWILNKISNKPSAGTTLKDVSRITGFKYDRLLYQFVRKSREEYETPEFRIVKIPLQNIRKN